MWHTPSECNSRFMNATGSVGAAVLFTLMAQHLSTRQSELYSEICCWMLLPALISTTSKRVDQGAIREPNVTEGSWSVKSSGSSLWAIAGCLIVTSCYKAELGVIGLLPLLTPLLLFVEKSSRSDPEALRTDAGHLCQILPLNSTVWGTALIALFLVFFLSDWSLREYGPSIFPVGCLLIVYVALDRDTLQLPPLQMEETILPLSYRIIPILLVALCVQMILFGVANNIMVSSLLSGVAKALSWYFLTQVAQYTSWAIAPRIIAFTMMATRDPFVEPSQIQCLLSVAASFLALSQVVYFCPKQAKYRPALWILALVALIPYTANMVDILLSKSAASSSFDNFLEHPVEALMNHAKADFATLVQRQSRSYAAAYEEYRRRYAVEPPPGFDAWYDFAVQHQSPIIDDFDVISNTISPFWKVSGIEINAMMDNMLNTPNNEVWHCLFLGEQAETRCTHSHRSNDRHIARSFNDLLGDLHGILPDINMLVNHLDEPRVLIQPVSLQEQHLKVTNMRRTPNWDAITKFCDVTQVDRTSRTNHKEELFDMPFITDSKSAMDLCQHPEYSLMHGLFMSPSSFNLVEGLVPILSTGAPSVMGDLLFPSPAYNESEFRYDKSHDVQWELKKNKLYWAGSTTGGFGVDDQWRHYQRQRFVALAQNLERRQHHYLRARDGAIRREASSFLNRKLYDVGFTNMLQCTRQTCRGERAYFDVGSWADRDEALHSKLVFDIDGNGISGRYYKLLASKSVPLKQTLLREWHDDRLMPWVHYVPVSQGMEELPELVLYLTSTETGQRKAKEIANQGQEWMLKAFRDVDLTIYMYRLLLELARLQDVNREAM